MDRIKLSEELFLEGYNCTQSVVLAYQDVLGIDKDVLLRSISSFGSGMARMREVCGAVSGMIFVLGALKGYSDPKASTEKAEHYALIQKAMKTFQERNNSYICADLLSQPKACSPVPEERTAEYYKKRPCKLLVSDAVTIIEELL